MDTVIDKRTKAYRDSVESDHLGVRHDVSVSYTQEDGIGDAVAVCTDSPHAPPEIGVVNFEVCNDPHGTGCTIVHPPNDVPRSRTEPCYACIRRNY